MAEIRRIGAFWIILLAAPVAIAAQDSSRVKVEVIGLAPELERNVLAVLELAPPLIVRYAIDEQIMQGETNELGVLAVLMTSSLITILSTSMLVCARMSRSRSWVIGRGVSIPCRAKAMAVASAGPIQMGR